MESVKLTFEFKILAEHYLLIRIGDQWQLLDIFDFVKEHHA